MVNKNNDHKKGKTSDAQYHWPLTSARPDKPNLPKPR